MKTIVDKPDQVIANIHKFQSELAASKELPERLGQVHAWYAYRDGEKSGWLFAPSKFVGYQNNSARAYLATYKSGADGGITEKALARWFSPVDPDSRLGRELTGALREFLANWNRSPRKNARVSIVGDEARPDRVRNYSVDDAILRRISTDPEICGGRPTIKGTRMRISDIVDMLAAGASTDDILKDYPYLSREDIAAALGYAAKAADHRVIHAA